MGKGVSYDKDDFEQISTMVKSYYDDLTNLHSSLADINNTMTTCGWKGNTSNKFNSNIDSYLESFQKLETQFVSFSEQLKQAGDEVGSTFGDFETGTN